MKKMISLFLCLALLLCICSFSGCEKDKTLSATGEYNGQKITMSYEVRTDIACDYYLGTVVSNGYAVFYDIEVEQDYRDPTIKVGNTYNVIDLQGRRVFDSPYGNLWNFDADGWAAAQKRTGEYVLVSVNGEEKNCTEEEYKVAREKTQIQNKHYIKRPSGIDYPDSAEYEYAYTGPVYQGLATYTVPMEQKDGMNSLLLGLCDENSNIIIPAFIPVTGNGGRGAANYYMNEDTIIICDDGHYGIIKITRE